jgi:hypothetical protein
LYHFKSSRRGGGGTSAILVSSVIVDHTPSRRNERRRGSSSSENQRPGARAIIAVVEMQCVQPWQRRGDGCGGDDGQTHTAQRVQLRQPEPRDGRTIVPVGPQGRNRLGRNIPTR